MYAGTMAETGPASEVLKAPGHPYTKPCCGGSPVYIRRGQGSSLCYIRDGA